MRKMPNKQNVLGKCMCHIRHNSSQISQNDTIMTSRPISMKIGKQVPLGNGVITNGTHLWKFHEKNFDHEGSY